jgi:hypothetical protein
MLRTLAIHVTSQIATRFRLWRQEVSYPVILQSMLGLTSLQACCYRTHLCYYFLPNFILHLYGNWAGKRDPASTHPRPQVTGLGISHINSKTRAGSPKQPECYYYSNTNNPFQLQTAVFFPVDKMKSVSRWTISPHVFARMDMKNPIAVRVRSHIFHLKLIGMLSVLPK